MWIPASAGMTKFGAGTGTRPAKNYRFNHNNFRLIYMTEHKYPEFQHMYIRQGLSLREIAEIKQVSPRTVRNHLIAMGVVMSPGGGRSRRRRS